jgi:mRNA degradation ribonuclease J1/J2
MWNGYKRAKPVRDFLELCESLGMNIMDSHASGHAYRSQLESAILKVSPKTLIPVHTESAGEFGALHKNVVLLKDREVFQVKQ